MPNEFIKFVDEDESTPSTSDGDLGTLARKILIVDDDEDTHIMTVLLLKDFVMDNHSIELIHAYSGQEAYQILQQQPDIVVMLLDVVMESSLAGLDLVKIIRKEPLFDKLRIILRTGQSGDIPELETIRKYDINDYLSKTELTMERLHGCFITTLRSYQQLERLEHLAEIDALTRLYKLDGLKKFIPHYNNQDHNDTLVLLNLQLPAIQSNHSIQANYFDAPLTNNKILQAFANRLTAVKNIHLRSRLWTHSFAFLVNTTVVNLPILLEELKAPLVINDEIHKMDFCNSVTILDSSLSEEDIIYRAKRDLQQACIGQHALSINPMITDLHDRTAMLALLQQDFHAQRLFLLYQPQIDIRSNTLIGFEALIRWHDSSGRVTPPEAFIELAESSGFILELGEWILKKALQESKPFFLASPHLRVSVNVSAIQFVKDDFVSILESILTEQQISGHNLTLEITESVGLLATKDIRDKITGLQSLGVHISIDDFGTGFSNLSQLNHLSADHLKIDRSFIHRLDTTTGAHIVDMIINLGRKLNLHVIAEGVETHEQQQLLLNMGCWEAQGYLHAQPLSVKQLHQWIKENVT